MNQSNETIEGEIVPPDTQLAKPEQTQAAAHLAQMADDGFVTRLEKAAENAPKIQNAVMKILVSISQPGDWIDHDGTACLTSAGAERYMKQFPFSFEAFTVKKQTGEDEHGSWYMYVYSSAASLWDRTLPCEGTYGTRDKFLSFTKERGWRSDGEINEGNIMAAAKHICIGNGIKALLGLRGIRTDMLKRLITDLQGDPSIIKGVKYDSGKSTDKPPATAKEKVTAQEQIARMGKWLNEIWARNIDDMKAALKEATLFEGADGKEIFCDSLERLSKNIKWTGRIYPVIKKAYEEWQSITTAPAWSEQQLPEGSEHE